MAGITQTIDNLNGGISEQPDDRKLPNQVNNILNGIPDPVEGLVKRPGAARVGTSKLANVQSSGKFFHYHRDETEGSYIGQVDNNGVTRMWKTSDGSACTMAHGVLINAITNAGSGYTSTPTVTISAPNVTGGVNAKAVATVSTSGTITGLAITDHGSGYTSTPTITIAAPASGTTATATAITTEDMTTQYLATTGTNNDAAGHSRSDSTGPANNINVLTINDYSFISNKDITNPKTEPDIVDASYSAGWGDKTGDATYDNEKEQYSCYIEILRTENGRQYGLNVYNSEDDHLGPRFSTWPNRNNAIDFTQDNGTSGEHPGTIVTTATRLKFNEAAEASGNLNEGDGTGTCEGIGTQVFSAAETNNHNPAKIRDTDANDPILSKWGVYVDVNAGDKRPEYRHNLTFRITINGQQGVKSGTGTIDGNDYRCTYARTVDLLHGGEGWVTGDSCLVKMTNCKEESLQRVVVTDHEVVKHKANIMPARPVPTPFDTEVAVSVDAILGGIVDALNGQYNWGRNSPNNPPAWERGLGGDGAQYINADYPPNWNTNTQNNLGNDENGWNSDSLTGNAMLKKQSSTTGQLNIKSGSDHINYKIIGNGIYLYCKSDFNIEVLHSDLMRVMHREVNSVADLPAQCRDGYVVRVLNFENSQDDDYYLKFQGENGRDGAGSWVECPKPQIRNAFDQSTFPMALVRDAGGSFTVKPWLWENRRVGDNKTNPKPTFLKTGSRNGTRINKCVFFRNRLGFLAGSNVILARPGTVDKPDFWANTALTISAIDPIDIASSSLYPSNLHDALEITAGLLCFSSNQQFLLTSDDTVLDPNTAKLKPVSSYNYSEKIPPISLGTTFAFVDTSNKYSRLNEVIGVTRETEPLINNASILVPTLIPKDVDLITNSRENNLIFISQSYVDATSTPNADLVYGFKYLPPSTGQGDRKQAAWFKWRLSNPLKYHFVVNDEYFFIDTDDFLQKINFKQMASDPVVDDDQEGDFPIHLDNYISVTGGVYSSTTNKTTFSSQSWLGDVTQLIATHDLVIVDTQTDSTSTRIGRYAICGDKTSSSFTVPGDWSEEVTTITITNGGSNYTSAPTISFSGGGGTGATATATISNGAVTAITITNGGSNYSSNPTISFSGGGGSSAAATASITGGLYVGYLYVYRVRLPKFYIKKQVGESNYDSNLNGYLTIQRVNLNFGKVGLYETELRRTGKDTYTDIHESVQLDEYEVSDAPYLNEEIKTIPIYEKNTNLEMVVKSEHPAPATLRSLSWEGAYSPKQHRRV
tara:strand:+ start:2655 stop:6470 length:3816 start_codon:yes stop_codon:yes gene_type:complete